MQTMWYTELEQPHGNLTILDASKSIVSRHIRHSLDFTKSLSGFLYNCKVDTI